ncbi:hypothetical protein [Peribacillus alkalitolerans]|uniref:hypothetical protein n=1 Tax=Peribacillus alkalitolerans TaxID=1550385 RepID=UPI0013D5FE21|nr:hypothetical protein [Peribacillus alkalitolerans]
MMIVGLSILKTACLSIKETGCLVKQRNGFPASLASLSLNQRDRLFSEAAKWISCFTCLNVILIDF